MSTIGHVVTVIWFFGPQNVYNRSRCNCDIMFSGYGMPSIGHAVSVVCYLWAPVYIALAML